MRISDWSSDVCSSDLGEFRRQHRPEGHDDAAALEIGGGQPAMAERDALAGGGGLDDHRGIAEAGAALDVDAADAGGLQPVAPVRALVLARDLVVQQGVMEIGRAHVRTPCTKAQLVCSTLTEKN